MKVCKCHNQERASQRLTPVRNHTERWHKEKPSTAANRNPLTQNELPKRAALGNKENGRDLNDEIRWSTCLKAIGIVPG